MEEKPQVPSSLHEEKNPRHTLLERVSTDHKAPFFLFLFVLIGCFIYGVQVRKGQLDYWQKNKQAFYANNQPLMTTLDAPFFVDIAKQYEAGQIRKNRGFPDVSVEQKILQLDHYQKIAAEASNEQIQEAIARGDIRKAEDFNSYYEQKIQQLKASINKELSTKEVPNNLPALSIILAKMAPWFEGKHYLAGTYFIIVAASLFMIPLGLYFWYLGVPLAGILGGLIGNFSLMYFMRSSIGRIDTDILNLFFPFLIALFILLIGKAQRLWHRLAFATLAALSTNLFMWWYLKPPFVLAFGLSLVAYLLAMRETRQWKVFVPSVLLFGLITMPYSKGIQGNVMEFFKRSVVQEKNLETAPQVNSLTKPIVFPNTVKTISEAQTSFSIQQALKYTLSSDLLSYLGLLSFLVMAILYWQQMIPLAPVIVLAALSFKGANRMIMFLGPFIGIGLGYLLTLTLRQIRQFTRLGVESNISDPEIETQKNFYWTGATLGITLFCYVFLQGYTHINYIPRPSINPHIMMSFKEIKKMIPNNSAILTWWDLGYALIEQTDASVFHDGGSQFSPKTHFIAKNFVSTNQQDLFDSTKFLATQGNWGINYHKLSKDHLLKAMHSSSYQAFNSIYLLYTYDMISKYAALMSLGNWDIESGKSKGVSGYRQIQCNRMQGSRVYCGQYMIDLDKGLINNRAPLKRQVQVMLGKVIMEKEYDHHNTGFTFQVLMDSRKRSYEYHLIDEGVFQSNFNQMYILGRYNKDLYEEVYNLYPLTRLFKFKFQEDTGYANLYNQSRKETL